MVFCCVFRSGHCTSQRERTAESLKRMRILILSSYLPAPDADHAGGVVLWRMIQGLAVRNQISLISFANDEQEKIRSNALLNCCDSVRTVLHSGVSAATSPDLRMGKRVRSLLLSSLPYDVWRFRSQEMATAISEAVVKTPYDIIQIEFTQMGQYVGILKDHPRTIFRQHDLTFTLFRRQVQTAESLQLKLYRYMQWRRMVRYELAVCRHFHTVIVPSRQAKAELLAHLPHLNVSVVPFGVSLARVPAGSEPNGDKRILFVGAMGRRVNIEAVEYFCQKIWPQIQEEEPHSEFWIVGSNPPRQISQLAQEDARIKVTGFVGELEPFYAQATVFVAPIVVGGGVVTRILNAMAMSKAVVTTSFGNEGIEATAGRDLLVADEPCEFTERVIELLRNPERRRQIGENGRAFVQSRFSWESIIARFERVYADMNSTAT
jgi:glycosyltransferase involved in cell wall biosynthesis